jgi:hypothetical protein
MVTAVLMLLQGEMVADEAEFAAATAAAVTARRIAAMERRRITA